MSSLSFESFFRAINGTDPFPWQSQAAARLATRQQFVVTVPTGMGKSSLVDAAVWAAGQGAWRRIAFVVDRRIVVDAVYDRALRIQQRLADSSSPGLRAIAQRLGELQVVRLRGGVFGDDDWVLYPERVTVLLTTIDQLGSRLLFRGYGVSPRRWPMHAGFVADDMLVVVDEAHLSTPFLQTLDALRPHGVDIGLLPMSATLGDGAWGDRVGLTEADLALPTIRERLAARKPARLQDGLGNDGEFIKAAATAVQDMIRKPGVRRVALVVNRVAIARRCFERLGASGTPCKLLTGRVRPIDRDAQLQALVPLVMAGRTRGDKDAPLVVVATQTIEVGADFDFDGLVTECAPLSSLRQRFGRVDRLGLRGQSEGLILHRKAKDRDDPVYGCDLEDTWDWLTRCASRSHGVIDFGLGEMGRLLSAQPAPSETIRHAASLLPTHVDLLAQTGPYAPAVDISAWLHGPSDRAPDVTLVWRDDLDAQAPSNWGAAVSLLPPLLREAMPMPVAAVRRWLTGAKSVDNWGDDGGNTSNEIPAGDRACPVLRWRGPDDCAVIDAAEIRPGDTLVVPASYGGCDAWGWAPDATDDVQDLADPCLVEHRAHRGSRRPVLRLTRGHWEALGAGAAPVRALVEQVQRLTERIVEDEDLVEALHQARQDLLSAVSRLHHPVAQLLIDPRIERHPEGLVLRGRGTEEVEGVLETAVPVPLTLHHADVGRWAERLADGRPSAPQIVEAARVHDAGKAEPRMQALLHGSALAAAQGPALAKSALRRRDEQEAAWASAGLPRGFRHEFASLEFERIDDALVRLLVVTHHGYGRPWLVNCDDVLAPGARFASLESHWPEQWARAISERNPWGLARLEWLLRAADARASIEEAVNMAEGVDGSR